MKTETEIEENLLQIKEEETQITLTPPNSIEKYTDSKIIDGIINEYQIELKAHVPDLSTAKGRKEIASFANKFRLSKKPYIDAAKKLIAESESLIKGVNVEKNRIIDALTDCAEEGRRLLDDWEREKEEKEAAIEKKISDLRSYGDPGEHSRCEKSSQLKSNLEILIGMIIGDSYGDREEEAAAVKADSISKLSFAFEAKKKQEEDAIKLADFEKKEESRIANEVSETKRKDAIKNKIHDINSFIAPICLEQYASALTESRVRLDAVKIEGFDEFTQEALDAKESALKTLDLVIKTKTKQEADAAKIVLLEKEKVDKKKEDDAEKVRIAKKKERDEEIKKAARDATTAAENKAKAKQQKEDDAKKKREANKANVNRVHAQAVDNLVERGIDKPDAEAIIMSIADGQIRNVTIAY